MSEIPTEAYAFLGAVAVFLLLLIIFFLYLNKKLCFAEWGGFPCIDQPKKKQKPDKLGDAYGYDDAETSSDSDDEVLTHYQAIQKVKQERGQGQMVKDKSKDPIAAAEEGKHEPEIVASPVDSKSSSTPPQEATPSGSPAHEPGPSTAAAAVTSEGAQGFDNSGFKKEQDSQSFTSTEKPLSASGDTLSFADDPMFDVSDLQERELISKCGSLQVSFSYNPNKSQMVVTVLNAQDIPSKDRGGANNIQVRLLLLPTKKVRHKTKIKPSTDPIFNEHFTFSKVAMDDVKTMGIRFRVYGCERMRRERMIGESVLGFASLALDQDTTHWLTLEPRSNLSHGDSKSDVTSLSKSDSASSTQSMQHGGMPELLIGLAYNGTTGRLSVEVIKGSNFRNMAMNRAPDTYVKLTLMSPTGQEITRSKTSIRRGQPNPLYKETFMFQVAQFQLPDVTLMVSVYNKKSMKRKEMIGWFSLGLNNSGEEELSHWNDMRESRGEQVCRWHVLLES